MDPILNAVNQFFKTESSGGLLLIAASILAMICANSLLHEAYEQLLEINITVTVGGLGLEKTLHHFINDGLMAVFFLLVGLEIKREIFSGELSSLRQASLPVIAACGGVIFPALIYAALNYQNADALRGWAIPAATDIAFALGILALFGSRVPVSLKMFLTAVAVIDDLIAILIIAFFYTAQLSGLALMVSAACLAGLLAMNLLGVRHLSAYMLLGLVLWFAVLKSGVHATLAGVALGLLIPHTTCNRHGHSMLSELEHGLHPYVAWGILPLFAFANAGINLSGIHFSSLIEPVTLGIGAGLVLGKQVGIFLFSIIAIKLGIATFPAGASKSQLYAICLLCGVGFTMSLFIGSLAFDSAFYDTQTKLGVIGGSVISATLACIMLSKVLPKKPAQSLAAR